MGGSLRNQRLGRQRICRHLIASRAPMCNLLCTPTLLLLKQCRHQLLMLLRDFDFRNIFAIDKLHASRCSRIAFLERRVAAPRIAVEPVRCCRADRVEMDVGEALCYVGFTSDEHAVVVRRFPERSLVAVSLVVFRGKPLLDDLHETGNTVHSLPLPAKPLLDLALASLSVDAPSCKCILHGVRGSTALENGIATQNLVLVNWLRRWKKHEDVEMIPHNAPSQQPNTGELRRAPHKL